MEKLPFQFGLKDMFVAITAAAMLLAGLLATEPIDPLPVHADQRGDLMLLLADCMFAQHDRFKRMAEPTAPIRRPIATIDQENERPLAPKPAFVAQVFIEPRSVDMCTVS